MMRIAIDMPVVEECFVGECAYNTGNCCRARAITIGNGIHPGCDTFLNAMPHSRVRQGQAGVGACKVSACQHNDDYECMTEHIAVGHADNGVSCLTYRQRAASN